MDGGGSPRSQILKPPALPPLDPIIIIIIISLGFLVQSVFLSTGAAPHPFSLRVRTNLDTYSPTMFHHDVVNGWMQSSG